MDNKDPNRIRKIGVERIFIEKYGKLLNRINL